MIINVYMLICSSSLWGIIFYCVTSERLRLHLASTSKRPSDRSSTSSKPRSLHVCLGPSDREQFSCLVTSRISCRLQLRMFLVGLFWMSMGSKIEKLHSLSVWCHMVLSIQETANNTAPHAYYSTMCVWATPLEVSIYLINQYQIQIIYSKIYFRVHAAASTLTIQ